MHRVTNVRKTVRMAGAAALLMMSSVVSAQTFDEKPSAGEMVVDAVVVRPLYFVLSQLGSALYAVTLPFSLMGLNTDDVAETLVVQPVQAGFLRCLGCDDEYHYVRNLSEHDGSKRIRHFVQLSGGISSFAAEGSDDEHLGLGIAIGTRFILNDRSRYDVILGARYYDLDQENLYDLDVMSYQVLTRFGRDLGPVDLMFKFGGHYWDASGKLGGIDESEKSLDFILGVGADAHLTDSIRIGLEYTRLRFTGDVLRGDADSLDLHLSIMF